MNATTEQYHIQWMPPNNTDRFDLDYYKLLLGNRSLTVHSEQDDEIFFIQAGVAKSVMIAAVDQCNQQSEYAGLVFSSMADPCMTNTNTASPSVTNTNTASEIHSSNVSLIVVETILLLLILAFLCKFIHNFVELLIKITYNDL